MCDWRYKTVSRPWTPGFYYLLTEFEHFLTLAKLVFEVALQPLPLNPTVNGGHGAGEGGVVKEAQLLLEDLVDLGLKVRQFGLIQVNSHCNALRETSKFMGGNNSSAVEFIHI